MLAGAAVDIQKSATLAGPTIQTSSELIRQAGFESLRVLASYGGASWTRTDGKGYSQ